MMCWSLLEMPSMQIFVDEIIWNRFPTYAYIALVQTLERTEIHSVHHHYRTIET
jgi:hypothetical protein